MVDFKNHVASESAPMANKKKPPKQLSLAEWLSIEGNTQKKLGAEVGIGQTGISEMLKHTHRDIYVLEFPNGSLELWENKRLGKKAAAA